jgi:polyhydroxyalkanoate synthesis regulator protein
MALFRTILILIIIFSLIRIFTRYILPSIFTSYMDNKVNEFSGRQKKYREQSKKKEGEVTIDYSPGNHSKNKPSKGDYVDYVEVKD